MLMYSSKSTAMAMARRSSRARSPSPPTTGSFMLKPIGGRGDDRGQQLQPPRPHLVGQHHVAAAGELHRLVEIVRADAGGVVIALQELAPVGDLLGLQAVDRANPLLEQVPAGLL